MAKQFYYGAANYIEIEPGDVIVRSSIKLGDGTLRPGDRVSKLGSGKVRDTFEMKQNCYLEYVGYVVSDSKEKDYDLVFRPYPCREADGSKWDNFYYSFMYSPKFPDMLLMHRGRKGCYDLSIKHLEIEKNCEQLRLF